MVNRPLAYTLTERKVIVVNLPAVLLACPWGTYNEECLW